MPFTSTRTSAHVNHAISLLIILQYIPRLIVIFPLNWRIIKNTGVVAKTAWTGAAYNLILYLLASHVSTDTPPPNLSLPPSLIFVLSAGFGSSVVFDGS